MLIYGISDFLGKILTIIFLIVLVFICSGCTENETEFYTEPTVTTVQTKLDTVLIDEKYYKLYFNDSYEFYYELLDLNGNIIDKQCTYYCEPKFNQLSDDIVKIYTQTGTGRITSQTQYYNTRKALLSPVYNYVLCEKANYVAVGDIELKGVVVYDMFDEKQIISTIPLDNLYYTVDEPIEDVRFSEDLNKICIVYKTSNSTKNTVVITIDE